MQEICRTGRKFDLNWGAYITVFFVASSKFLFAPSTGMLAFGLTFWETIIVTIVGGIVGVTVFYFGAEWLIAFNHKRRIRKEAIMKANGTFVKKKVFTPFRRKVIRIKKSFGLVGIAIVTPCIISIPIGSILAARFFHHRRETVFVIYFFVVVWAFILSYFNDAVVSLLNYLG